MSITSIIRLVLAVLAIVGLTVSSIVAWIDLHGVPKEREQKPKQAADRPVLCYGLVDVETGIRPIPLPLPGRVKEVRVKESDEVEGGALLLRLEDEAARLRQRQSRAELDDAEIQLKEAQQASQLHCERLNQQKEALEVARTKRNVGQRQLDRLHRWLQEKLCSPDDIRDAKDVLQTLDLAVRIEESRLKELQLSDPSLAEARARRLVEARSALLKLAEHDLTQHELRATEKGKVFRILVGPGDFVAGVAGQPVLYFCPDRPRIVRADIGQEWAARLSPGQKILLQDDEVPELQWDGEIRRISDWLTLRRSVWPGPQEMHDQRTAECIIEPKSGPRQLRIGQKLRAILAPCGR